MATISAQLRNFKEPDKDEQTAAFFAIPADTLATQSNGSEKPPLPVEGLERMDINAVLSLGVQGEEDAYVSTHRGTRARRGSEADLLSAGGQTIFDTALSRVLER